jgi:hypothetical protein
MVLDLALVFARVVGRCIGCETKCPVAGTSVIVVERSPARVARGGESSGARAYVRAQVYSRP